MATSFQVVFDCANPAKLAHFWADLLGYKIQDPPAGFATWQDFLLANHYPPEKWDAASAIVDPENKGARLYFQKVPEGKVVKNRVHLDINISGGFAVPMEERKQKVNTFADQSEKSGATKIETREQQGEFWIVMADIEGNEFCVH